MLFVVLCEKANGLKGDAFLRLAEKGELRAPDDDGGGTLDDISNIHKNQQ